MGHQYLGDNKTLKGPVLSIEPPVRPDPYTLGFVLTASKGQVTKSANVNVLVKGDLPPSAEVRNYDIINAQDICGENTNSLSSQKQIILDGNNSRDPEGGPLKYNWTQIGGPPVTISNPNSIRTTVNNDSICGLEQTSYLEFRLDVIDSVGQKRSDNVTIPVKVNQLPIARINAPNEVQSGQNFTSDGSASTDAEGPVTEYDWFISLNGESIGEENIPKSPIVDFTVPSTSINSTILLQLRVKDSEGAHSKLTEKYIDVIPDYRPIANASQPRLADGSGSGLHLHQQHPRQLAGARRRPHRRAADAVRHLLQLDAGRSAVRRHQPGRARHGVLVADPAARCHRAVGLRDHGWCGPGAGRRDRAGTATTAPDRDSRAGCAGGEDRPGHDAAAGDRRPDRGVHHPLLDVAGRQAGRGRAKRRAAGRLPAARQDG